MSLTTTTAWQTLSKQLGFSVEGQGFTVQAPALPRSYPLVAKPGSLNHLAKTLEAVGLKAPRKLCIVTDSTVAPLYLAQVEQQLSEAGFGVISAIIPAGEGSKNFQQAEALMTKALKAGLSRKDAFIALGGGVVGDLTGYCAASYYRGTGFIQVPTTLLAMVDSSVGGKVGINCGQVKNSIGAFYQPKLVLMDPELLHTLPEREVKAGLAEVLKYAWLERTALGLNQEEAAPVEPTLFEALLQQGFALTSPDTAAFILRCCALKAAVVRRDEQEQAGLLDAGGRVCLNLGHTFAHAIESVAYASPGSVLHGEAVAMGMNLAAELSKRLGLLTHEAAAALRGSLHKLALPAHWPENLAKPEPEALVGWMLKDKKNQHAHQIRLILPTTPTGTVMIKLLDEPALLLTLWQDWLDGKLN